MFFKERKYERYGYKAPVLFQKTGTHTWTWGVSNDISQGGLFLNTSDEGFEESSVITLNIVSLIKGILFSIDARIVRVVQGRGIALEFVGASASPELKALISHLKSTWSPLSEGPPPTPWEKEKALGLANTLMERAQFMDYYRILDLSTDATEEEVVKQATTYLESMLISQRGLTEREIRILKDAISLVKRLGGILANPTRRWSYNIAMGLALRETAEKIRRSGMDLSPFHEYYTHRYKERAQKAAKIAEEFTIALSSGDSDRARQLREEGLKLNPFNPVFWEA